MQSFRESVPFCVIDDCLKDSLGSEPEPQPVADETIEEMRQRRIRQLMESFKTT